MAKTIEKLILEFFMNHPNTEFKHAPIDKWVTEQYTKENEDKNPPQDVPRAVRELALIGRLVRVKRGLFKYDPDQDHKIEFQDFPEHVKQAIFERDGYKCKVCGLGREDGVEIAADHKIPRSKNGKNTLENGQTLCIQHNNLKKNYSQTEAGKKYFIEIYNTAVANDDQLMIAFCKSVFDAYDKHYVNGHIPRPDPKPK